MGCGDSIQKITGLNVGNPFNGYIQQVKAVYMQHKGCNDLGVHRIKCVTEHPRGGKDVFNGL